jgi:hypothetical protein
MGILEKLYELKENSDFDSGAEWAIDEVIQMTIDFFKQEFYEGLDDWNDKVLISDRFNNIEEFISYYKRKIKGE